jgi:hypothetical protein
VRNSALASNAPAVRYKFRNGSGSLAMFAVIRPLLHEQLGRRSPAGLILEIEIRQLLPGAVDYNKARFLFFGSQAGCTPGAASIKLQGWKETLPSVKN